METKGSALRTGLTRTIFAVFLIFVFVCHIFPLTDTDIWWHLSAARWICQHGIPRTDPFCVSSFGLPWLDAQWGFQLIVYALWKLGGEPALIAAKAATATGITALLVARAWTWKTMPFLLAFGIYAAVHGRYLADVRPLWMTLLLLALQYRWIRDALDGRRALPWVQLLFTQILLVQVQGLHWLGPAQALWLVSGEALERRGQGSASAFPKLSPLWLLPVPLFLCGLANPYGWRGFVFPLRLLGRILPVGDNVFSHEVAENIPYWRWLAENPDSAYPFLLIAAAILGLLVLTRFRKAVGEALLFAVYGGLGLMAQRNIPLFLFAALAAFARIAQAWPELHGARNRSLYRPVAAFCVAWALLQAVLSATDARAESRWELPGSWETPFRYPRGAVEYLQGRHLRGACFNEMRHGGYLGWRLFPEYRPFIDGRMILHDAAFMREFLDLFNHPERFAEYQKRYGITLLVLPIGEDDRYLPLAAYLSRTGAMRPLYCDGAEVLLASQEAWRGGEIPFPWTPESGRAAAKARFGKNPELLRWALERLGKWERLSSPLWSGGSKARTPGVKPEAFGAG